MTGAENRYRGRHFTAREDQSPYPFNYWSAMQKIISKFEKKAGYPVILMICLNLITCTPVKKAAVEVQRIALWEGAAGSAEADFYLPKNSARVPVLIIASLDKDGREKWADFSQKFARSNHSVLVIDGTILHNTTDLLVSADNMQAMHSAIARLRALPVLKQQKIAVLGVGPASFDALCIAVDDSTVAGVIALSPSYPKEEGKLAALLASLAPRPLLIIASANDSQLPAEVGQKLYQAAKEPKKLVWLSTDKQGEEVLKTDQEPIVRRVVSMLVDRHSR
jgi:fermentation-respiration switch protein FrsA (DUF1100 family)